MSKTYKVKLKLIETHYLYIDANDIQDATQQAEYVIVSENDREIEPHTVNVKVEEVSDEC